MAHTTESDSDINIPKAAEILSGAASLQREYGDLIRAQAKSVIAHAIRRGVDPATAALVFAAHLAQLAIDEHAEIDDWSTAIVIERLIGDVRESLISSAMREQPNGVAWEVR